MCVYLFYFFLVLVNFFVALIYIKMADLSKSLWIRFNHLTDDVSGDSSTLGVSQKALQNFKGTIKDISNMKNVVFNEEFKTFNYLFAGSWELATLSVNPLELLGYSSISDTQSIYLHSLALSSDGLIYGASGENAIVKIDPSSMKVLASVSTPTGNRAIVIGPDGFVYSGGDNGVVYKRDASDFSVISTYNFIEGGCSDLEFGPDGYLYTVGYYTGTGGYIHKIDSNDMSQVDVFQSPTWITACVFDGAGLLYVGERSGEIRKIDPSNMSELSTTSSIHSGQVAGMTFGPDNFLYTCSYDQTGVQKVDPFDLTVASTLSLSVEGRSLVFGPDGFLYFGDSTPKIYKIDITDMSVVSSLGTKYTAESFVFVDVPKRMPEMGFIADDNTGLRYNAEGSFSLTSNFNDVVKIGPKEITLNETVMASKDLITLGGSVSSKDVNVRDDLKSDNVFAQGGVVSSKGVLRTHPNKSSTSYLISAASYTSNTIHMLKPDDLTIIDTMESPDSIESLTLGGDGYVYVGTSNAIWKFDPILRMIVNSFKKEVSGGGNANVILFDGGYLYTGFQELVQIDAKHMRSKQRYVADYKKINSVVMGSDGFLYVAFESEQDLFSEVHKIEPSDFSFVSKYVGEQYNPVMSLCFGSDGYLYAGQENNMAQSASLLQIDPSNMSVMTSFSDYGGSFRSVVNGKNGDNHLYASTEGVYSGTNKAVVIKIDVSSGGMSEVSRHYVSESKINEMVYGGDGYLYIATDHNAWGTAGKNEKIDPSTMTKVVEYTGYADNVNVVDLSYGSVFTGDIEIIGNTQLRNNLDVSGKVTAGSYNIGNEIGGFKKEQVTKSISTSADTSNFTVNGETFNVNNTNPSLVHQGGVNSYKTVRVFSTSETNHSLNVRAYVSGSDVHYCIVDSSGTIVDGESLLLSVFSL